MVQLHTLLLNLMKNNSSVYSILHTFNGTVNFITGGTQMDGSYLNCQFTAIMNKNSNYYTLYGMSTSGGIDYNNTKPIGGYGVIFSYNLENNEYNVLHNFGRKVINITGATQIDGYLPYGSLTASVDTNGNDILYGMTSNGGTNNYSGTIFSLNLSQLMTTNNGYTILYNFGDAVSSPLNNNLFP